MGGPQNRPFLLHPADLTIDDHPLVGAPAVHAQLQRWARQLDVSAPVARIEPEETTREARALPWIAAWYGLLGALLLIFGGLVLIGELAHEIEAG